MRAMVLNTFCSLKENQSPLELMDLPDPVPVDNEILIRISVCGVCHTELDEIEGRLLPPQLPVVPGHQVIGRVEAMGRSVTRFKVGERVGVAWIYSACGKCTCCLADNENLCPDFKAAGKDVNGGYAEYMTVSEKFAYYIPGPINSSQAAPLLCAGAIGYRSLRLSGLKDGQNLGLTGFGASAHLVLKMVQHQFPKSNVFVFARNGKEREFSRKLGAVWAGEATEKSPEKLHCIIDTTPAWQPVVEGLLNLVSGGRLIINAIRKEEIDKEVLLHLSYADHLWMEKEIKSVANVSRRDVSEFLDMAAQADIRPEVQEFALEDANKALLELKMKRIRGAKVLKIG